MGDLTFDGGDVGLNINNQQFSGCKIVWNSLALHLRHYSTTRNCQLLEFCSNLRNCLQISKEDSRHNRFVYMTFSGIYYVES